MTIYCPTCNNSSDKVMFVGEFCEECTIKRLRKQVPDQVEVYFCRICGRVKAGQEYYKPEPKAIAAAIEEYLHIKNARVKIERLDDYKGMATLRFHIDVDGTKVTFEKEVRLKRLHKTCSRCLKERSGYFEATVQLRGVPEKVENTVEKISRYISRYGAFVTKVERVDNGLDVYTSDKKATAQFFASRGLKPKVSYVLAGLRRNRRVYKHVYLLRFERPRREYDTEGENEGESAEGSGSKK